MNNKHEFMDDDMLYYRADLFVKIKNEIEKNENLNDNIN
jgi:hypothetical protein